MATHSSILAWKIPWMRKPSRLPSMGLQKSQTGLRDFTFTFIVFHRLCQYPHQEFCCLSGACRSENCNCKIINCLQSTTSLTRWLSPLVALLPWNDSVLNPASRGLTRDGRITTSRELQISTVEGLVSVFAKSFIFQYPRPLPVHDCVKEGRFSMTSSSPDPCPQYQGSAALRC